MPRRYNQDRSRRRNRETSRRRTVFMRPGVQISIVLVAALIIFIILQMSGGGGGTAALAPAISVDEAWSMYQNGACAGRPHRGGVE